MRRTTKWSIPFDGKTYYIGSGDVVLVGCVTALSTLYVWTEEVNEPVVADRWVRVFEEGQALPAGIAAVHIGSVHLAGVVRHLYGARQGWTPAPGERVL